MSINNEDIKVLRFKDELMSLLHKYKYDIVGSNLDNGDITIETESSKNYILKDNKDIIKEVFVENKEHCYEYKNVMEEYILTYFKGDEQKKFCFGNFGRYHTGIITKDVEKAKNIINTIVEKVSQERIKIHRKDYLKFHNGDEYIWIKPCDNARGYRFNNAYIDKNIGFKVFHEIIYPICLYCGEDNINII
ncbi:hypothetical protein [Clostridium botulinum]|uniref:hypothetical protein n=1 Tax=Clostridium botulinum TaxID=1491 RepID=UPI001C9B5289|nr:hypothetical protein [Clostridium botulinum]MBY6838688.1 hypothetical protein [Clostridium botulinum]